MSEGMGASVAVQQQIYFAEQIASELNLTPQDALSVFAKHGFKLEPDDNDIMFDASVIYTKLVQG